MDYLIYLVIFLVSGLLLIFYLKNYIKLILLVRNLNGPKVTPIFGHVLKMTDSKWMINIANNISKYGSVMRAWIFFIPLIFVYEPEHLKIILGNSKKSKKSLFYSILHNFLGQGLITNNGYKWKKSRKLIQPYFQMHILENYVKIFAICSIDLVNSLKGAKKVKITPIINNCVLEVLHMSILGVSLKDGKNTPFREGEVLLIKRLFKPWLMLESVFQYSELGEKEKLTKLNMQNYVREVLKRRRLGLKSMETISLLDMFIEISETSSEFTDEDIVNEACTFMLAGQDSVASTLAYTLFYLAKYQDIQKKVVDELDEICNNDLTNITIKEICNMAYLEQCIKETLRLVPTVPMLARVLTEEVQLGNYSIPSGTNIIISPFITHRLPHVFSNPLEYNPERFSPENSKEMHPYAFIPFSMGPRNCIGSKFALIQMKMIISAILKNYHLSLNHKNAELELTYRVTLRVRGGVWLRLKPRLE